MQRNIKFLQAISMCLNVGLKAIQRIHNTYSNTLFKRRKKIRKGGAVLDWIERLLLKRTGPLISISDRTKPSTIKKLVSQFPCMTFSVKRERCEISTTTKTDGSLTRRMLVL